VSDEPTATTVGAGAGASPAEAPAAAADLAWGLSNVEVRFGHRTALAGVSLRATAGAVVAVVGGDGAGKSTLLRTLAGLRAPNAGRVMRPPARDIGFVSAGAGVYVDLTVTENLDFVAGAYGLRGARLETRAAPLLARAGLDGARDRLAGRLSGGMRQKLAFVLAVVHDPSLLVLDEPTTGVDPVSRADIWRLIAGAAASGAAVVIATTYLDEAERAANVLVLDDGRALATGTPDEIVARLPGAAASTSGYPPPRLRPPVPQRRRASRPALSPSPPT
jgi:ABC-2 type transport system ATP-binding protein